MAKKGQGKTSGWVDIEDGKVVDADAALLAAVPELLQTRDDGMTIREWIASLTPFFVRAREIEIAAKVRLGEARQLTRPTNGDEDTAIRTFITRTSAENKVAEEHWKITSIVYNFQRRLTSVRNRTTGMLDEASKIAQDLHNRYADGERRRVDEANRKAREEAERVARDEQEAEAARLEALALKAESKSTDLSERERKFVELVVGGMAPMYAAQRAGYKDNVKQGDRLMATLKVATAISDAKAAAALRQQATATREAPVQPQEVRTEKADLGGGGVDRTTKSLEVFDEQALINAIVDGRMGIPRDLLQVNPVKGNEYARSLGELVNRWPGCRLKKSTRTV